MLRLLALLLLIMLSIGVGPVACSTSSEVAVRPTFTRYDRVAIVSNLAREDEELFIPLYMQAFPHQTLVERRDIQSVLGEQDILPERLDERSRAMLRKVLGVQAIVYPTASHGQMAIKVIDTETGAIAASCFVTGNETFSDSKLSTRKLMRKAISDIKSKSTSI